MGVLIIGCFPLDAHFTAASAEIEDRL